MTPLQLRPVANGGGWIGNWPDPPVRLWVRGGAERPDADSLATLEAVMGQWTQTAAAIERFVRALPPDHAIVLQPPANGVFAARTCGFEGQLFFGVVAVPDPLQPARATISFHTGLPDGYITFEAVLEDGCVRSIESYCS